MRRGSWIRDESLMHLPEATPGTSQRYHTDEDSNLLSARKGRQFRLHLVLQVSAMATLWGQGWKQYGGDNKGQRFSEAAQINASNVQKLRPAWESHTGALDSQRAWQRRAAFETTPIFADDRLYLTTPFDQIIALDPASGVELWRFDPHIKNTERVIITSRGVALWDPHIRKASVPCSRRLFIGTLDATLVAIDADSGRLCGDFGEGGVVNLTWGIDLKPDDQYEVTSAPTVVGNVVITGSSIGDNHRVEEESGVVRGFDVHTGKQLWAWDPIPWSRRGKLQTGGANAWSTMAADDERGIVYVPTSSPSPDFYGAFRPGDNRDADSIVALDVLSGRKLWAFQVVHHDLWDYDLAAEPLLLQYRGVPAVLIATKMGTVFILDRASGKPLVPVSEVPVPQSTISGEHTSPTQPRSTLPALVPDRLTADNVWGPTSSDRQFLPR